MASTKTTRQRTLRGAIHAAIHELSATPQVVTPHFHSPPLSFMISFERLIGEGDDGADDGT